MSFVMVLIGLQTDMGLPLIGCISVRWELAITPWERAPRQYAKCNPGNHCPLHIWKFCYRINNL